MATHLHKASMSGEYWCPYTGAEGRKAYELYMQISIEDVRRDPFNQKALSSLNELKWCLCIGPECPRATVQKNTFGNQFVQCGGVFEPDAGNISTKA